MEVVVVCVREGGRKGGVVLLSGFVRWGRGEGLRKKGEIRVGILVISIRSVLVYAKLQVKVIKRQFCVDHVTLQNSSNKVSQSPHSRATASFNFSNTKHPQHNQLYYNNPTLNNSNNEILDIINNLNQHNFSQNPLYIIQIISKCAKSRSIYLGIQFHSHVTKTGFNSNIYINTSLVDMYGKCGLISLAHQLFDEMPERNDVTWNALISGYLNTLFPEYAISLFVEMQRLGVVLSPFSLSGALVGCVRLEEKVFGLQVHCLGLKLGLDCDVVVGTGLIDIYGRCGNVVGSQRVFDQLCDKNVMCCTSMVSAYSQNDWLDEAVDTLRGMVREGCRPINLTYNNLLSACCCAADLYICNQIHSLIIKEGFESDTYVVVTLLIAYSECSCSIEDFYKVCFSLTEWDQVAWNAVITGFSNLGASEEAVKCFSRMREAGMAVDYFTFSSVLTSLGTMLAIDEGSQIHGLIFKSGNDSNIYVLNSLVSMYARCDKIEEAKQVFSSMQKLDVVSWNGLLSGCAYHGYTMEVVEIFEQMRTSIVRPNQITFLIVLSACSHGGLLDVGLRYFNLMVKDESLPRPKLEHYACVVDLYGRAGYLHKAESFISTIPIDPGPYVFKTLLSACQIHGSREIAEQCARKLAELCPNDPASYVLLANVLSTEGNWKDAAEIRKLMMEMGVTK